MNKFNIKLPTGTIKTAVKALNEARQELKRLADQRAELEKPDANRRYSQEHIEKELIRIEAETGQITNEITAKIDRLSETALDELKAAFIPSGDDLLGDNAADVALFNNGLILNTQTLDYILNKHDNAAFHMLAAKYAKEREWSGYEYITSDDAAKEYIDTVLTGLKNAASNPFGYQALQYAETKGEYRRLANEYGLSKEFDISNGDDIDTAIIEPISSDNNAING